MNRKQRWVLVAGLILFVWFGWFAVPYYFEYKGHRTGSQIGSLSVTGGKGLLDGPRYLARQGMIVVVTGALIYLLKDHKGN